MRYYITDIFGGTPLFETNHPHEAWNWLKHNDPNFRYIVHGNGWRFTSKAWLDWEGNVMTPDHDVIGAALAIIDQYGDIDGAHHKQWVIDQVVRTLIGYREDYKDWVAAHKFPDGPYGDEYEWDTGIAP